MRRPLLLLAGTAVALVAGAYRLLHHETTRPRRVPVERPARTAAAAAPGPSSSNILPEDYVGPAKCAGCHDEKYKLWRTHPHSRMNADATEATVRGDFSGVTARLPSGEVTFSREDGAYTMTLARAGKLVRRYVVTRVVGSRFMQFYIGRQTAGDEASAEGALAGEEQKLPFGYWFKLGRWLPTSYFDPVGAETKKDGTPAFDPFDHPRGHKFSPNCMLCHNTFPYAYRVALPDGLMGIPATDLLVANEPLRARLARRFDTNRPVREQIDPARDLITQGISCEGCHYGGRDHAREDGEPMRFLPTSPFLKVRPVDGRVPRPVKEDAYAVNAICAQCHRAIISLYPNGAGTWNSREALDMAGGACKGAIKCTDCHDPHRPGGAEAQPDAPNHLSACVKCHQDRAEPAVAAKHSRHPEGAKVTCLDCHMPRATQGLEEVVRTHMISSPTDTRMLASGSWNSCNLCHLDRSIAWTLGELERGWGKKLEAKPEWASVYGGLDAPVGPAWLEGENPSMRLVASQAYARAPAELGRRALPKLVAALDDPVAVNRVFATFTVERLLGRSIGHAEYDVSTPRPARSEQVRALSERLGDRR